MHINQALSNIYLLLFQLNFKGDHESVANGRPVGYSIATWLYSSQ